MRAASGRATSPMPSARIVIGPASVTDACTYPTAVSPRTAAVPYPLTSMTPALKVPSSMYRVPRSRCLTTQSQA